MPPKPGLAAKKKKQEHAEEVRAVEPLPPVNHRRSDSLFRFLLS